MLQVLQKNNRNMSDHKYILEPYKGLKTRYHCPGCQSNSKTFSLYIDAGTGEHLNDSVGRCNRESSCGYHYTPKQYFQDNNISVDTASYPRTFKPNPPPPLKQVSYISTEIFKASLRGHNENQFVSFLTALFGAEATNILIGKYFIGSSKHWKGATVFWQIDTQGKIRTGKIMLYNPKTGKRVKEPFSHINWVHKVINEPEYELRQCLFGEHLLIDKTKPVAIVESEKTAVIASVYLPQFIWLAVGSITNLNAEKCAVLKGRAVSLFPDLDGFDKWTNKAEELSSIALFTVSEMLESKATEEERQQGLDIADYLIRYSHSEFKISEPVQPESSELPVEVIHKIESLITPTSKGETSFQKRLKEPDEASIGYHNRDRKPHRTQDWQKEISVLEDYFKDAILPTGPIKLDQCSTILNAEKFIESHLATLITNNGNFHYLPFLHRLQTLKQILNP